MAAEAGSSTFTLKTLGKPQTVTVGPVQSAEPFQISHADIDLMQAHTSMSKSQTLRCNYELNMFFDSVLEMSHIFGTPDNVNLACSQGSIMKHREGP